MQRISVLCEWRGYPMQHRYEDLALIADVIRSHRPAIAVELGTDQGGFAAFLADTVTPWGGEVFTFDREHKCEWSAMQNEWPNLHLVLADVLKVGGDATVRDLIGIGPVMMYCDNGAKQRELDLYAPQLGYPGLLGTHDYGTEVDATWAEAHMAALGFAQERHAEFEALAHPDWYPQSLTRFWTRR